MKINIRMLTAYGLLFVMPRCHLSESRSHGVNRKNVKSQLLGSCYATGTLSIIQTLYPNLTRNWFAFFVFLLFIQCFEISVVRAIQRSSGNIHIISFQRQSLACRE